MNIEELAFENRKTLANLNRIDLLDIIEFLQEDRKQWINQFTKTYNESVEIQKENQELKSQLAGTTHCFDEEEHKELKKQLEEWEYHLKCSKEILDIQAQKGNYDYDEYMLGLYNGMEYIIALFEKREPDYINGKDVEFTNNKSQQKEFIKYLEDEIKIERENLEELCKLYKIPKENNSAYKFAYSYINKTEEILQKYKEIIGVMKNEF